MDTNSGAGTSYPSGFMASAYSFVIFELLHTTNVPCEILTKCYLVPIPPNNMYVKCSIHQQFKS